MSKKEVIFKASSRLPASSLSMLMPVASESQEGCDFIQLVGLSKIPHKELLFHIPNGGHRHPATASKLKREGVKPGVPDYFYPVAKGGYHGLWIELKNKKGKLSVVQKGWIALLKARNYEVVVAHGAEDAFNAILDYSLSSLPDLPVLPHY